LSLIAGLFLTIRKLLKLKKLAIILSVSLAISIHFSFIKPASEAILGHWYAEALEESHIKVMKSKAGSYFGKISHSSKEYLVGEIILKNITYNSDANYWEGTLMPPHRNFAVDAKFYLEDEKTLQVKGQILFISKNYLWKRVEI